MSCSDQKIAHLFLLAENLIIIISTIIVYLLCGRNCAYMIFSDPQISLGRQALLLNPILKWRNWSSEGVNKWPKTMWQVESKPDSHSTVLKQCKIIQGDQITFSLQTLQDSGLFRILSSRNLFPTWGNSFLMLRLGSTDTWWMRQLLENTQRWGTSIFRVCAPCVLPGRVGRNDFLQNVKQNKQIQTIKSLCS